MDDINLVKEIQNGNNSAFEELLDKYHYYLTKIVNKYCFDKSQYEDLFQLASIGLYNASIKYDVSLSTKLTSFAYNYIIKEITDYLKYNGGIRLPDSVVRKYREYKGIIDEYYRSNGVDPSYEYISEITGDDVEEIEIIINANKTKTYDIDNDYIAYQNQPLEEVKEESREVIIEGLTPIQDQVFTLRKEGKTYIEIKKITGLTEAKIRTIECIAIRKLRRINNGKDCK